MYIKHGDVKRKIHSTMTEHQNQGPAAAGAPPVWNRNDGSGGDNAGDGDNPELLLRVFLDAMWKLWLQMKLAFSFIMVDLGGYQALDNVVRWGVRNPHTSICLIAFFLVMVLPFLMILGFAVSTLLMTFTGFLVLEGVLLAIVAMLLLGCLGALLCVLYLVKQMSRAR